MNRGNLTALILFCLFAGLFVYFFINSGSPARPPMPPTPPKDAAGFPAATPAKAGKQYAAPPAMAIDVNKKYTATIITSKGTMVCELLVKDAPNTVNNFIFLARDGFYNGTTFHRVIPNFMIQGGDPTASGMGGPGYEFADELGSEKPKHIAGTLSMANSGPHSNGSQFFITHVATPWLDGKHTVFGRLTDGVAVRDAIGNGDVITSITIDEK